MVLDGGALVDGINVVIGAPAVLAILNAPTQRERFLLHALYDLSYAEVGKLCGCSKGAVEKSVNGVKKIFQKFWNSSAAISRNFFFSTNRAWSRRAWMGDRSSMASVIGVRSRSLGTSAHLYTVPVSCALPGACCVLRTRWVGGVLPVAFPAAFAVGDALAALVQIIDLPALRAPASVRENGPHGQFTKKSCSPPMPRRNFQTAPPFGTRWSKLRSPAMPSRDGV